MQPEVPGVVGGGGGGRHPHESCVYMRGFSAKRDRQALVVRPSGNGPF